MKTITDHWEDYLTKVYPSGTGKQQHLQLHQAFFAGWMACISTMFEEDVLDKGRYAVIDPEIRRQLKQEQDEVHREMNECSGEN